MSGPAPASRLDGRTVALPESRELDRLATMLEELGATTVRCPLVSILDAPDPALVDAWLARLCAGRFADLVFLTGEGLRRLLARARVIGCYDETVAAVAGARKITRGPKPARALHEIGLASDLAARVPTSRGVADALLADAATPLRGRSVGLQLYGSEPNLPLVSALTDAGAAVDTVAPYIYAPAADADRVLDLITRLGAGTVDALAFTSASQVDRLYQVAEEHQRLDALKTGLARTRVAAVGPVVAEACNDRDVTVSIGLDHGFVMKRLCQAIAEALGPVATGD